MGGYGAPGPDPWAAARAAPPPSRDPYAAYRPQAPGVREVPRTSAHARPEDPYAPRADSRLDSRLPRDATERYRPEESAYAKSAYTSTPAVREVASDPYAQYAAAPAPSTMSTYSAYDTQRKPDALDAFHSSLSDYHKQIQQSSRAPPVS